MLPFLFYVFESCLPRGEETLRTVLYNGSWQWPIRYATVVLRIVHYVRCNIWYSRT